MRKASLSLQDLRERMCVKAKAEKAWRFWGLYVHVCKMETLREAYRLAKRNNGAPGIDGVTFKVIEESGREKFLEGIREELVSKTYLPMRYRKHDIPKGDGKHRTLRIPAIRDRVVQGALKLILEPIFEADFQEGSYGYRPNRTAHEAVNRVSGAILRSKIRVLDVDLKSFFDTIRHHILFEKVAKRVNDDQIMRLLKLIVKAGGKRGVAQGSPISPLLANIYLNEVDKMLERAQEATKDKGKYLNVEYARFADDLVILMSGHPSQNWLIGAIRKRLMEELAKVEVEVNAKKTRLVDLTRGESFAFLGFEFRRIRTHKGKWGVLKEPRIKARGALTQKLKETFRRYRSQPIKKVVQEINPILRGWTNYFRIGHSAQCFDYVQDWVERKIRRHMMKVRQREGFGWRRWSREWLYKSLGLYKDYQVRYYQQKWKAQPA